MQFSEEELERYSRHILVPDIGASGQDRLRQAKVLVVGAGGLGAPLLQQLVSSGIGHVGVIDPDIIELSNLQRQALYVTADIGRRKVDVALERLTQLNPAVTLSSWPCKATPSLLERLVPDYDYVCDATDNSAARLAVSDACVKGKRTLVFGAVQGLVGQYVVFRPHNGGPCYRCLYPHLEADISAGCSQLGVIGPATTIIAGFMALSVLKECLGLEETAPEVSKLFLWDGLTGKQRVLPIKRSDDCLQHQDD
ncbi:HesA/MoeB/ThiF family protein [Saccharibacter floricola]|uniref:HesA/MoeB/ThiF family protein n=1 Tax=Saccharibacter floricola TaxID=231053 RepID=UPI0003828686|nr:HesA/MoeB/ThiF family protein [Saccharibacter floricola]